MNLRLNKIMPLLVLLIFAGNPGNAQSLEDYLQIAAEKNPEVRAAYLKFEAAMQRAPQVSSLPDPTLTISAFGRMMETRLGAQEARFTLMQMFPWFGTLEAKENAAIFMAEASFQEYLNLRNELFFELKSLYAELYALEETIQLKKENLTIIDSYRQLALSKFRSGTSPMVNVVRVDIQKEADLTELELLEEMKQPLKAEFNLLLSRRPDENVQIQDTLTIKAAAVLQYPEENFEKHPSVTGIKKQKQAYEVQQEIAEKEGMPMVGLGVDYSVISKRTDANPDMNGRDAIMPMVSVTLPIFRKKIKAAIKEAEFMKQSMEQEEQSQKNELYSQYELALYELEKAQRLIDLYEKQVKNSLQANQLLISSFSNATADFNEVLEMNRDILMYKIQKIEAIKNGLTAEAKIDYLLSNTRKDEQQE